MEGIAALLGISLFAWIALVVVAAVALPAAYLWMLIDAIIRDSSDFASNDNVEKVLWIVAMLAIQPVAAVYFFVVWLPKYRARKAAQVPVAPVAATPAG